MTTHANTRTITALTAVAEDVMSYTLEGFLREVQPLFTAVYLSPPEVAAHIWDFYPDSYELRNIVANAILYHKDMDRLKKIVSMGFFEYEVRYLLKFGMDVPTAGARLVPIFYTALEHAKELNLSDELQEDLVQYIELRRVRNGFTIVSATKENLVLHFAKDVIPE
mgnify:CR=1 FL=1